MGKEEWGYFEGERIWLGKPEDRPMEEYVDSCPTDEDNRPKGMFANDNQEKSQAKK